MVGKITSNKNLSCSLLPSILQENPFQAPNFVLTRIATARGKKIPFAVEEKKVGESADWGNTFEPHIIDKACETLNFKTYNKEVTEVYKYKDNFLEASLDGLINNNEKTVFAKNNIIIGNGNPQINLVGNGVIEAKLTSSNKVSPPPKWRGYYQLQGQLLCTGLKWGVIATLYKGTELVLYVYEADRSVQAKIIKKCKEFYKRLETMDYYDFVEVDDLINHYPIVTHSEKNLNDIFAEVDEYKDILSSIKLLEKNKKLLEVKIMGELGNHQIGYIEDKNGKRVFEVEWRMRHSKAQPSKFVEAKPEKWVKQKSLSVNRSWLDV